jgi:hypothetical protein
MNERRTASQDRSRAGQAAGGQAWARGWAARAAVGLAALAVVGGAGGCGKKESIVAVGDGKKLSAEEIDADPVALLPGGAVMVGRFEASAFLSSQVGPRVMRTATRLVPLTPEMNFEPKRDLKRIYGAAYSMQGADFAFVAQGDFDPDAIKKAADRGAVSALGKPLQKTSYGGNDLYLTGDVGFVALTKHSLLLGNPAGLRRALDRIRDGRIKREVPDWASDVLKTEGAELAVAGDTRGQAMAQTVVQMLPFLNQVEKVRLVGDFKDPGMNFAGALSYPDAASAQAGDAQVKNIHSLTSMAQLLSFGAFSNPFRTLQTRVDSSDVQFVAQIDGPAFASLFERGGQALPSSGTSP